MRAVQVSKDGAIELNWMFLPTFIGQNYAVLKQLGEFWEKAYPKGILFSDDELDELSDLTLVWLSERFPAITGLLPYLQAIKHVEQAGEAVLQQKTG